MVNSLGLTPEEIEVLKKLARKVVDRYVDLIVGEKAEPGEGS